MAQGKEPFCRSHDLARPERRCSAVQDGNMLFSQAPESCGSGGSDAGGGPLRLGYPYTVIGPALPERRCRSGFLCAGEPAQKRRFPIPVSASAPRILAAEWEGVRNRSVKCGRLRQDALRDIRSCVCLRACGMGQAYGSDVCVPLCGMTCRFGYRLRGAPNGSQREKTFFLSGFFSENLL